MSLILDLIIIISSITFLYLGFKKGFFKSLTDLIIMILSVFIPYLFTPWLSEYYYKNFLYKDLIEKINEILNKNDDILNSAKNILELLGNFPKFFCNVSKSYCVNLDDILKILYNSQEKSLAIADLLKPSILKFINIIIFAVLALITFIVLKLFLKVVLKLPKISVLGLIDSILGLCMGILKFFVFSFILVLFLKTIWLIIPTQDSAKNAIDDSKIFKYIYNINMDVLNDYLKLNY